MIIAGGGYEVIDLGVDAPTSKFLSTIAGHPRCIVGLSVLLTVTMPHMAKSVGAIKEAYPGMNVMVGGAPVTQDFCNQIGADFTSHNPHEPVEYLNKGMASVSKIVGNKAHPPSAEMQRCREAAPAYSLSRHVVYLTAMCIIS